MGDESEIEAFIAHWRDTGGSELANTQSFINGLCHLLGIAPPNGSRADDAHNDYVFERRVFQDNGDGTTSFGRIDLYKRDAFILEAKQGSDADRAAADRGEDDLDLFGQTASARLKRGTARRGTPGWAKAMVQAKGQAERYARALPADHGWPPFLLIADIGYCIEVYADFTGTGKAYAQFPDRSRYRVMLDDLRDAEVRKRLAAIWTDPKSLDPSAQAAQVTREIADLLATVSRRLEARGHSAETVSGFLMRVLFTMFAEDTGVLLPRDSFKTLLRGQLDHPEHLHHQLSALWRAMDCGAFAPGLGIAVKHFNGYLFKDTAALPLELDELKVLIEASQKDWTEVEPAIFGTLLERALNPKERAKLGAHYTPRAYVERLVGPTIIEPLRADWAGIRVAVAELIDQGKPEQARRTVEAFHGCLAATRVLDPACGTGNFLYVAMARMKELEGEVLDLLVELGDLQYVAELTGHTITPENFLGIEINPRAAAIAQLVLWIGYLQWHFRVNGRDRSPPEPILRDIRTIENRDALIDWDSREFERDKDGAPVTRWDGETMKLHAVTGRPVPDESARMETYRYVRPRAAEWPKADFIIGNPPFIGGKDVRDRLGDGYFEALFRTTDVPESADFVMHWWDKAALAVRKHGTRRFGFVTTNSITQLFSRRVIAKHLDAKDALSLRFAVPNHPWVDEKDGAAVRIAMTVAAPGKAEGLLLTVTDESEAPDRIEFTSRMGVIGSDLRVGADLTATIALKANDRLCSPGVKLHGDGFIVTLEEARKISPNPLITLDYNDDTATYNSQQPAASSQQPAASSQQPAASSQQPAASSQQPAASSQQPAASSQQPAASSQQPAASSQQPAASSQQPAASSQQPAAIRLGLSTETNVIFPYRNGRDLAARPRGVWAIDLYGLTEDQVRERYPAIYQHLLSAVRPQREGQAAHSRTADARKYAEEWWLFGKTRPELRRALARLDRYIVTVETAKHRVFQFLPISLLPDNMLVCIASADAYALGILSSRFHVPWAIGSGGRLGMGDDPRYSKSRCFDPFPFPADIPETIKERIRIEAEALDALRKRVLAEYPDLTLTKLYNVLEALREGRPLTDAERAIHDRGLVTLIRQHHDTIDTAVADAYGWGDEHRAGTLDDETILSRLAALNAERAAEEARGLIRYLRPEFQDPGYRAPMTETLDLGDVPAAPAGNVIPWPSSLPEQIGIVQAVLAGAARPLGPQDIARNFKGKRPATIRPLLDALAGLGMARRLSDGRYAA